MSSNPDNISSPCISLCYLNDDTICQGCFRSINEITLWAQVDEKTRRHFLDNVERRKKTLSDNA